MHILLEETGKKINGVENYYDRGQRINTTPNQELTKKGSQSQSDIERGLKVSCS